LKASVQSPDTPRGFRELLCGVDRNDIPRTHALKRHDTVNQGKQSVVSSAADIPPRMDLRSALTQMILPALTG